MTKRLEVLKSSLTKKEAHFNQKIDDYFADVKSANGQPLNDKRGGHKVMSGWQKQNDSLKNLDESIQKTKTAIDREEAKIANVEQSKDYLPKIFLEKLEKGELNQWRKYPNRFFVPGVDKARIIWDVKKNVVLASHFHGLNKEQLSLFKTAFDSIKAGIKGNQHDLH